jgi:maltooligosyltrehalose synthase
VEAPPLGGGYWGADTSVRVPAEAGGRLANVFTRERLAVEAVLPVARALASFPVALLVRE